MNGKEIVKVMRSQKVNSDVAIIMINRNINKTEAYKIWKALKLNK